MIQASLQLFEGFPGALGTRYHIGCDQLLNISG